VFYYNSFTNHFFAALDLVALFSGTSAFISSFIDDFLDEPPDASTAGAFFDALLETFDPPLYF